MNFSKVKDKANKLFTSRLFWLQVCAVGIWLLVIQNYCGRSGNAQRVYVVGGDIDADVSGYVHADVSGSVDVDNTVSVEVENTVRTWNW